MTNILFIILGILIIVVIIFYNKISSYFFGNQKTTNPKGEFLKVILQIIGGIILIFGAYYSLQVVKSANDGNELIERGNTAERFKDAISMLEANSSNTRLGGIYALDNIAKDNIEYREQVFNILVSYINNTTSKLPSWSELSKSDRFKIQPSIEIRTIMKLLFFKENYFYRDLDATFENAKLYGSDFDDFDFSRSIIINSEIQNSSFQKAWFIESVVQGSDFTFSDFTRTIFTGSTISDSSAFVCCSFYFNSFTGCKLRGTDFSCSSINNPVFDGASVSKCSFDGVDISTIGEQFGGGSIMGACFTNNSSKNLSCIGNEFLARGLAFDTVYYHSPFEYIIKSRTGEKAIINHDKILELEGFPKGKFEKLENLIGTDKEDFLIGKGHRFSLFQIANEYYDDVTGWRFSDTGVLTKEDARKILQEYNETIDMLNEARKQSLKKGFSL